MGGSRPGRTAFLITVSPVPGKYAFHQANWWYIPVPRRSYDCCLERTSQICGHSQVECQFRITFSTGYALDRFFFYYNFNNLGESSLFKLYIPRRSLFEMIFILLLQQKYNEFIVNYTVVCVIDVKVLPVFRQPYAVWRYTDDRNFRYMYAFIIWLRNDMK